MGEETSVVLAGLGLLIEDFGDCEAYVEGDEVIVIAAIDDDMFDTVYENVSEHPNYKYAEGGGDESKFVFSVPEKEQEAS